MSLHTKHKIIGTQEKTLSHNEIKKKTKKKLNKISISVKNARSASTCELLF